MRCANRRTVLAALGALGLGACTRPVEITGGKKTPKGGIGGTGIVGTLTDFGSLIVNGTRLQTDGSTRVLDAFGRTSPRSLAVGHALTVEAAGEAGAIVARTVRITHPVIGSVQRVSARGRRGVVADVPVTLEDGAIGHLSPGTRVAVSGVWKGRSVVASRIDRLAADGPAAIAGVVDALTKDGGRVAGVTVRTPRARLPQTGSFVTVVGQQVGGAIEATRIVAGRFFGAAGPLVRLSVEGFLEPVSSAPFFAVSGLGHSFDRAAKLSQIKGRRALFTGTYQGDFAVESALILPQDLASRRTLGAQMLTGDPAAPVLRTR